MTRPEISARLIGNEREPLVVIDGFVPAPDTLRTAACASRFVPAGHHYPGLRAPLPTGYWRHAMPVIATVLYEVFGYRERARLLDSSFSMVTTPPRRLSIEQRLPHIDSARPARFALIHYLSLDNCDGTAFFRHRATGFETISEEREASYYHRLGAELRAHGDPPLSYIRGTTPLFERIELVEARYNRALVYRSALLHSGAISQDAALSIDPARGRLTVTAFLEVA